jgi:H+-translocating NAD(P) transhydrogenase subunit alpha
VINVNMEDDVIRGLTVVKEGEITWPAPPPKLPAAPPAGQAGRGRAGEEVRPRPRRFGEPASAKSLAIVFGVGALLFWLVGAYAPASFIWRTSPSSCWPASSATWWSGTSPRRCTRR